MGKSRNRSADALDLKRDFCGARYDYEIILQNDFPAAINKSVVVANAVNVAGVSGLISGGFQPKSFLKT